jgi:SAM-dependent methyltransferase
MRDGVHAGPEPPLPPKRLRFMGESDQSFLSVGDQLVESLVDHVGLGEGARVLDIGCGYGRLAHALKRHGFSGSYLGVDVLRRHVRWCQKRLGDSRFEFRHIDIQNDRYNPKGELAVTDLDLGDERFDLITAFSLFTHMWTEDAEAYLRLIARSLTDEGRAAATFFLLDDEWKQLANANRVAVRMPFEHDSACRYESKDAPLHRVGYDGRWLLFTAIDAGLVPVSGPVYGTWSGRPMDPAAHPGYQDLVVFQRR